MGEILIGADPEFEIQKFWLSAPAYEVFSPKQVLGFGEIGYDGFSSVGELRPTPSTSPLQVVSRLGTLIGRLSTLLGSSVFPQSRVFAGSGVYYSLGGHVHFSGVEPDDDVLHSLDTCIFSELESVTDSSVRQRDGYHGASLTRWQPHGWEYRSPCSWISHPYIASGVLAIAKVIATAHSRGMSLPHCREDIMALIATIDDSTEDRAIISRFYRSIDRLAKAGMVLEEIEVISAWRKEKRCFSLESSLEGVPKISFSSDENMDKIRKLLGPGDPDDTYTIRVTGAHRDRMSGHGVFLPGWERVTIREVSKAIRGDESLAGVRVVDWDRYSIGLSYDLRQEPEKAAAVLKICVQESARTVLRNRSQDVVSIIEKEENK
mgnify:FL=1